MTRWFALSAAIGSLIACAACTDSGMPLIPTPVPSPPAVAPSPAPTPTSAPTPPVSPTARYEVVFESTWTSQTHPTDFPDDAHYSGLIGGTHGDAASFWREGALASEGIRRMAERGAKAPLDEEVNQAIGRGHAEFLLSGGALARSPGSVALEFDISRAFPLVTLVTMVAPSPDWFVGVSSLPLFLNGDWVSDVSIDLYAFDAGTDSGATYRSADEETKPRRPIARITAYPLTGGTADIPFGRMIFRRK